LWEFHYLPILFRAGVSNEFGVYECDTARLIGISALVGLGGRVSNVIGHSGDNQHITVAILSCSSELKIVKEFLGGTIIPFAGSGTTDLIMRIGLVVTKCYEWVTRSHLIGHFRNM